MRLGAIATWLAVAFLAILAVWTAGWFYMANRLEAQTRAVIDEIASDGSRASCDPLEATGYPLRLGLACDTVSFASADGRYLAKAGNFISAAKIHELESISGRLQSPLTLKGPDFPPLIARWDDLRFSTKYAEPLPQAASISADNVTLSQQSSQGAFAEVAKLGLAWRIRNSDLDIDLQLHEAFAAVPTAVRLPPLTLLMQTSVANGVERLSNGLETARGLSGQLESLRLRTATGDAQIWISGDYEIDERGLIDGDVNVRIQSPERLGDIIAELAPGEADTIRSAFGTLDSFTVDGKTPSIPVKIRDGVPSILFIKLPRIPPLP